MSVKPLWIWPNSELGLRATCPCTASLTSRNGFSKLHTVTLPGLSSNSVSSFTQPPKTYTYSLFMFAEAFPMYVLSHSALEDHSPTDTPGSTWSTTNITVQTHLSTSNKCPSRALHNTPLYSASFPTVLLLPVHARLFAILHQLVNNTLPHGVVDCLGFPQLLSELGYFRFQLFHPGTR